LNGHTHRDSSAPHGKDNQAIDYEVLSYLIQLYGSSQGQRLHEQLRSMARETANKLDSKASASPRSEALLICYGDSLVQADMPPLQVLKKFSDRYIQGVLTGIHVLPFFPSSSDDGFAVIDYRRVRPDLGHWSDIQNLAETFDVMADLVINHCSREHVWFTDFITNAAPGKDYFFEMDESPALTKVLRPRNSPLLTEVHTRNGIRRVWTTFSDDQVDLNFANPEVLLEFASTLFFYAQMGARYIRLDAIAYLWKRLGTTCMSLPETHMVVRILRGLIDVEELPITLITETNVPHEENVSYFGEGNEAHLVYQFSLAPLLLFSYLTGEGQPLVNWTRDLAPPPEGCSYFNFIASHDGIGLRPLEGLMPEADIGRLIDIVHDRGGFASMRSTPDGEERAYELNIALFSAFGSDEENIDAYVGAHQLLMAYQGVPGLYLNALLGRSNDYQHMEMTGRTRSINRGSWTLEALNEALGDPTSHHAKIFQRLSQSLKLRAEQPAFLPASEQHFIAGSSDYLMFLRHDTHQRLLVVASFVTHTQVIDWPDALASVTGVAADLLSGEGIKTNAAISLGGFQVMWLDLA
jgi:sucrose phosphorylase